MKGSQDIKAVMFDMDGTLIDTEPLGAEALRLLLDRCKVRISEEDSALFDRVWRRDGADMSAEEFFAKMLGKYGISVTEAGFARDFYEIYERLIVTAEPLPGADELLKSLHGRYKLALVTASTGAQAMAVLRRNGWKDLFDAVVSHDEYEIDKPDPSPYLIAAKELDVPPEGCLVIEDSENGVLSGKNANMNVIGVRAGNRNRQDLSVADDVVDTLGDINSQSLCA